MVLAHEVQSMLVVMELADAPVTSIECSVVDTVHLYPTDADYAPKPSHHTDRLNGPGLLRIGTAAAIDGLRYGRRDSGGWQQKCCGSQDKQKMHAEHYL